MTGLSETTRVYFVNRNEEFQNNTASVQFRSPVKKNWSVVTNSERKFKCSTNNVG